MIKLLKTLPFLLLSIFACQIQADELSEIDAKTQSQKLEELKLAIEKIRKDTNTPAVGIALVNKDGPYWVAGLGEADLEKHVKADENTMFRIGSVSKMFVGLSILKLVEEGKLHLDDEIHYLAPEIKYENKWEKTNPILLVHLLEHTTGWDDLHLAEIGFNATDTSKLKDALNFHPDSRTSRWIPGTRYAYSNIGPAVSAYIIEKVTGKKFEDYVQENFFNPLQMNNSTFYNSEAYKKLGAKLYMNNELVDYSYPLYRPAGTMNSSPKDMANLLYFFIQRGKYNDINLLSADSITRMETPKTTLGALVGITGGYGLHNAASGYKDYSITLHGHDGGIPGALTSFKYIPELQTGYVVFTNTMGAGIWQITELVNEFLLKDFKKQTQKSVVISPKLNAVQGIYVRINPDHDILRFVSDISDAIKISIRDNKIHRSPLLGGDESNDYAVSENLAVNPWSGLPSIAVIKDPLIGEALQIEGNAYRRTTAVVIYGKIALLVCLIIGILCNFVFAIIWVPRWLFGKIQGATLRVRMWPLFSSLAICISFIPTLTTNHIIKLGTLSPVSLSFFIGSLLYPLFTLISSISIYKYRNDAMNKLVYANAVILTVLHILFVCYLAYYGIIGYRSWIA
jgi:CubicO group peptidase (beta-lactamase class C family)